VKEILSVFSCKREKDGEAVSLNPDIEHFIKNNAIQFARQKVADCHRNGPAGPYIPAR
jgi:hypothetical protein